MGMDVGGPKKKGARGDINITPLIDVVLVLLIIFMVLVPSTLKQLTAVVPRKSESTTPPGPTQPLVLKISADDKVSLNDVHIEPDALLAFMQQRLLKHEDKVVFFDVHDDARYGAVVKLMDVVKGAGAGTLAIVTKD